MSGIGVDTVPSLQGLQRCTTKPSGSLVEPQSKDRGLGGGDGIRARRETSKWRTHVGIARLASRLSEMRSASICPMVLRREFPKCPSRVCILVLCNRGSFVFRLPPYKLKGEMMAATI
jgi:hypothetical protein